MAATWRLILVLSIFIDRSYFQLIALKPGIYSHCISREVFECLDGIFMYMPRETAPNPYSAWRGFSNQNMTSEVYPLTIIVNIFLMVVNS